MSNLILTDHFTLAVRAFDEENASLKEAPKKYGFVETLPMWEPEKWALPKDLCYNLAVNRSTNDCLQTGEIAAVLAGEEYVEPRKSARDIMEFATLVHWGAIDDGLRYLGRSFLECAKNEVTVALFFAEGFQSYD